MNDVRSVRSGISRRIFSIDFRKMSGSSAALHALQHRGRCVLQRDVDVRADLVVGGDGLQQLAGDLVGIGVEEAHPAQLFDLRQPLQQQRQAVFQAEVFAVAGGVLSDERDLANALLGQAAAASAMTDSKRRERNLPRSCGMMQNEQG